MRPGSMAHRELPSRGWLHVSWPCSCGAVFKRRADLWEHLGLHRWFDPAMTPRLFTDRKREEPMTLRELHENSTAAPWRNGDDSYPKARYIITEAKPRRLIAEAEGENADYDALLTVALRNAAPFLLAVVDAARDYREDPDGVYGLDHALSALDSHLSAASEREK